MPLPEVLTIKNNSNRRARVQLSSVPPSNGGDVPQEDIGRNFSKLGLKRGKTYRIEDRITGLSDGSALLIESSNPVTVGITGLRSGGNDIPTEGWNMSWTGLPWGGECFEAVTPYAASTSRASAASIDVIINPKGSQRVGVYGFEPPGLFGSGSSAGSRDYVIRDSVTGQKYAATYTRYSPSHSVQDFYMLPSGGPIEEVPCRLLTYDPPNSIRVETMVKDNGKSSSYEVFITTPDLREGGGGVFSAVPYGGSNWLAPGKLAEKLGLIYYPDSYS